MPSRSHSAFLVAAVALAALNLADVQIQVTRYFATDLLPRTSLFRGAFWIWALTATISACAGLVGGYRAIRSDSLNNRYLQLFVVALCLMIKVDGTELHWSAFNFSFSFGLDRFSIGLNVLGIAAVGWLARLRSGHTATGLVPLAAASQSEGEGRAV